MGMKKDYEDIPGTYVFDADASREGYHLNQFCISMRLQKNREAFNDDEEAYLDKFPMTKEQRQAVLDRDWNGMLALGGNIYYTSKLAANDGINFQQLAGIMTGMGQEKYRKMMLDGGRSPEGNRYQSEWDASGGASTGTSPAQTDMPQKMAEEADPLASGPDDNTKKGKI